MKKLVLLVFLIALTGYGLPSRPTDNFPADETQTDTTAADGMARGQGQLLSAFFGLDNGLPISANVGICRGSGKADGMPVIFDHQLDLKSMQAGDFRVLTQSGKVGRIASRKMLLGCISETAKVYPASGKER